MNPSLYSSTRRQSFVAKVAAQTFIIAFAVSGWLFGQTPSPSPVAAKDYQAEEPVNRGLDATLYMQTAAEYRAAYYQAYNLATTRLDELSKKPGKFAVVMDLDETVFDNSRFQAMLLQKGFAWDKDLWAEWEEKHSNDITLIPGAKEFIEKANPIAEVFFVSNRNEKFKEQAKKALKRLDIPLKDDAHLKLITDPTDPDSGNKTARIQQAEQECGCKVLLYVGDNLRDFDETLAFDKLGLGKVKELADEKLGGVIEARKAALDKTKDNFGKNWIVLPNPSYGDWKAPLGRGRNDFDRLASASFPITLTAKCKMVWAIPVGILIVCFIWTLAHWPKEEDLKSDQQNQGRLREFLVLDIRANSQYCYWYLALIGVIAAIVAANRTYFAPILNQEHLWPFGLSFLAASLALLFIPAGYGAARTEKVRFIWLRSVLCEQIVVIFTCFGIWEAFRILTSTAH